MTDRDPTPLAPTCPVCASRDRVAREKSHWLCGGCWTLFTGSQEEWERTRGMREQRNAVPVYKQSRREQEADA